VRAVLSGVNISVMEILMKKMLTVVFVFVLGVEVGSFVERKPPVAEAGQEPACAPLLVTGGGEVIQDMNGDGVFDPIAEAVRLLSWAFLGAPAPVAPCCAGGGPSGLPDTGQTQCFTCSGPPCDGFIQDFLLGQDSFQDTGCPNDANRFTDNRDGTVTDNCTGLMWQKDTADVNGDGRSTDQDFSTWCHALEYCYDLSFAGHNDWRLPNVRELQSIVDYGRFGLSIDPVFGAFSRFYWSSTSFAGSPHFAWFVSFNDGNVFDDGKEGSLHVRAVRSGP
jgi:uncharacterized protein DUF1566